MKSNQARTKVNKSKWVRWAKIKIDFTLVARLKNRCSKLPLLPQEKMVYTKLVYRPLKVGSRCWGCDKNCLECSEPEKIEHTLLHCTTPAIVWHLLLHWTKEAWEVEGLTPIHSTTTCLLATDAKGAPLPKWWALLQKIALRLLWNDYSMDKFGDSGRANLDDLAARIGSDFRGRVIGDCYKHKTQNRERYWQQVEDKWGPVVAMYEPGRHTCILPQEKPS